MNLFEYDSSRQALVCYIDGKPALGVHVEGLKRAEWKVTDDGLRRSLPRFGDSAPRVAVASTLPPTARR